MQWRVIPLETNTAALNMALDEACLKLISEGEAAPTIRFYRWKPSAISIGYFQNLNDEVDLAECEKRDVEVVRRMTGGGAVYHDYEGEVTYSLLAPENLLEDLIKDSYAEICGCVVAALKRLGIRSSFKPINDVMVGERKISGSAQTRKAGVLLQHGTVLYKTNVETMFKMLKVNQKKLDAKAIKSVYKVVTSVSEFVECGIDDVYEALFDSFVEGKVWSVGSFSEKELELAKKLVKEKYESKKWLALR